MMKAKMANPRMMVLARESRGLTQDELSSRMQISQVMVSKVEQGITKASEEYLESLSQHLRYPRSFFFEPEFQYPTATPFHRKRKALPKRIQSQIEAIANVKRIHIIKLLKSVDIESKYRLPTPDLYEFENNPCKIARQVRRQMRLPKGPIDNLIKVMEDAGIIIVFCNFGSPLDDAFTILTNGAPPIMYVNQDMPTDRIRFTLSHELAHIIMHTGFRTPSISDIEKEADLFASEFLAPSDEISPFLDNVTLSTLADLKPVWKMAMSALLMKAMHLEKLTPNQARYLWARMNYYGYLKREPPQLDLPAESPALLREIVDAHFHELNYTVKEMCKLLMVDEEDFRKWYLPDDKGTKLRIVK